MKRFLHLSFDPLKSIVTDEKNTEVNGTIQTIEEIRSLHLIEEVSIIDALKEEFTMMGDYDALHDKQHESSTWTEVTVTFPFRNIT